MLRRLCNNYVSSQIAPARDPTRWGSLWRAVVSCVRALLCGARCRLWGPWRCLKKTHIGLAGPDLNRV